MVFKNIYIFTIFASHVNNRVTHYSVVKRFESVTDIIIACITEEAFRTSRKCFINTGSSF